MEIKKIHEITITINKQRADIFSKDKLNLRFNNTFVNPAKIQTINTEYSFSFTLPITPTNEKIFDFANILSKRSKFNKRYKTNVEVDGQLVFEGDLLLSSVTEEGYKCNLYVNKLNTIDKIFGESTLNNITNWEMDYDQDVTINEVNQGLISYPNKDVFFPLVSYGMFQKKPQSNQTYTSKYLIDEYTTLYNENFYPSVNLLTTVKKCFESKGYTVDGDIFDDDVMKHIYMSTKLASEQDPMYNYGKPSMGKFEMGFTYSNYGTVSGGGRAGTVSTSAAHISVQLKTPKYGVYVSRDGTSPNWQYNDIYDVWSAGSGFLKKDIKTKNNILWRDNCLYAPISGYYKIGLDLEYNINQSHKFDRYVNYVEGRNTTILRGTVTQSDTWSFNEFPTEFHLLKNSDGNDVQLIVPDAIVTATTMEYSSSSSSLIVTNYTDDRNTETAYPHEPKASSTYGDQTLPYPYGYTPQDCATLNYDPSVNKNFILGCTSSGCYNLTSVIKNGKSWDVRCTDTARSRHIAKPYYGIKRKYLEEGEEHPDENSRADWYLVPEVTSGDNIYGNNSLPNSTMSISRPSSDKVKAHIDAIVYLEKNDVLTLKLVERQWLNKSNVDAEESSRPSSSKGGLTSPVVDVKGNIKFEIFSPDNISINSEEFDWNKSSRYPTKLNIADFLSNEEKMSDFINNFIKEFNLSYQQSDNVITINKQKIDFNTKNVVNLTDRISESEIDTEVVEFPSQMSVEYTINEDERGFYLSAEENSTDEQLQSNNWKNYADRGYDIIYLSNDEYAEESKISTKTSYCWYDNFKVTHNEQTSDIRIPIIAADEWMIDGYKDAEMMKYDGLSYNRRYWFPSTLTDTTVNLCDDTEKKIKVILCTNTYNGVDLSYKNKENTLLDRFFNISFDTDTNYIVFEVYLTTQEYINIKNGSNILVDDDVYIPIQLQGFDCSGNNKTKITAIKK